ncbi:MAG: cell division protein ZapA [Candidatus Hydrogenedentes bacterium]|nr:cell division protein ZapA [Candidatus Hydrogenedentota bacterium]
MSDDFMQVLIAGTRLVVPIVKDKKTTFELAAKLSERLKALEEAADRIDTQAFALRAAFDFAAEAFLDSAESREEETQLIRRLDAIRDRLKALNAGLEKL